MIKQQTMAHVHQLPVRYEVWRRQGHWAQKGQWLICDEGWNLEIPYGGDIWALRTRFLKIRQGDTTALIEFLNSFGWWDEWKDGKVPTSHFWEEQNELRSLLIGEAPLEYKNNKESWYEFTLTDAFRGLLGFDRIVVEPNQPPVFGVGVFGLRAILYLSVWSDLVKLARFRYCAREDCPDHKVGTVPFELTSQHKRIFCSEYCGHLVSLRKGRRTSKRKSNRRRSR